MCVCRVSLGVVSGIETYVDKSAPRIGSAIKHVNNWEGRATVRSLNFNLFISVELGHFCLCDNRHLQP